MLVDRLRFIVEGDKSNEEVNGLGWKFFYGRRDFQNLTEAKDEDGKDVDTYFFLDPVRRDKEYSQDSGLPTGNINFEGRFMLLSKSDLDQEYDDNTEERTKEEGKWLTHIKPKIDKLFNDFENALSCEYDLTIHRLSAVDVINVFDENMDGILVNFKISICE